MVISRALLCLQRRLELALGAVSCSILISCEQQLQVLCYTCSLEKQRFCATTSRLKREPSESPQDNLSIDLNAFTLLGNARWLLPIHGWVDGSGIKMGLEPTRLVDVGAHQ